MLSTELKLCEILMAKYLQLYQLEATAGPCLEEPQLRSALLALSVCPGCLMGAPGMA